METKRYSTVSNLSTNSHSTTHTTSPSNSFILSPSKHTTSSSSSSTTITRPVTSSLQTLQAISSTQSIKVYPDSNNNNNNNNIGINRILTQPIFSKLSGDSIKEEQIDQSDQVNYSIAQNKSKSNPSTGITTVHLSPLETINGLSAISMANVSGHLMSSHLSNGAGNFFVSSNSIPNKDKSNQSFTSGIPNDQTSNYKLPPSSNSDLPSPSNSSNSSNPSSSTHHIKRHGEPTDHTRKREVRLQKNRDAARECRRKKKEYIKCLEERVTGLENQNKALIEELRQLKELYCQREDTNLPSNPKSITKH